MTIDYEHVIITDPSDHDIEPENMTLKMAEGNLNPELLQAALNVRRDFVIDMGWFDASEHISDRDRYDDLIDTLHIVTSNNEDSMVATMRLTRVNRVEESLSFGDMLMSQDSGQMAREVSESREWDKLLSAASEGRLYDLTRFAVPLDGSVSVDEISNALLKMIGVGIAHTSREGEEPVWIFTESVSMNRMLEDLGIVHEALSTGRINPKKDREDSSFCVAYPRSALEYALDNQDRFPNTAEHVSKGLAAYSLQ